MENKINIAELLKDCPKGMELDCTICNGVKFIELDRNPNFPIVVRANNGYEFTLTKYGQIHNIDDAKCVIFPKGKATWDGFQRPFKDGDVISSGAFTAIFHKVDEGHMYYHCWYNSKRYEFKAKIDFGIGYAKEYKYATEEEKQKLFDAIKDAGYKWNVETKTLEKLIVPKFKVGDRITNGKVSITIGYIDDNYYYEIDRNIANRLFIKNQDSWRSDKFDISTLKPFDKVLVRDSDKDVWSGSIFSHTWKDKYYCVGLWWNQCIPYEGNQHLLGATDNCDEYFKTWEN